jgi:outer membrane protein OmpA-like peptidoglycan-associated protein
MLRQTEAAGRRLARAPSRAAARPQVRSAPLAALKEAPAAPRRIEKKAPPAPAKIEKAPPAMAQPAPVKPVAAPAPPAAPSVVTAPPKDKVASLRPATRPGKDGPHMRIEFAGASTRLSSAAKDRLAALADELGSGKARLQLKAFAGGSAETASSARRLSLSRALAVRSFLIAEGLRSTRIDVRALGKSGGTGPAERVDIILLKR